MPTASAESSWPPRSTSKQPWSRGESVPIPRTNNALGGGFPASVWIILNLLLTGLEGTQKSPPTQSCSIARNSSRLPTATPVRIPLGCFQQCKFEMKFHCVQESGH